MKMFTFTLWNKNVRGLIEPPFRKVNGLATLKQEVSDEMGILNHQQQGAKGGAEGLGVMGRPGGSVLLLEGCSRRGLSPRARVIADSRIRPLAVLVHPTSRGKRVGHLLRECWALAHR